MKKFLLCCLLATTLSAQVALDLAPVGTPGVIELSGGIHNKWLILGRANMHDPLAKGYDPSYTYIITDFQPVIKQFKGGKWLIQFECSICKDLP